MSSTVHTSKAANTVLGFSDTREQMSTNEEVNLPDDISAMELADLVPEMEPSDLEMALAESDTEIVTESDSDWETEEKSYEAKLQNDITEEGFERAYQLALDPSYHRQNIEEAMAYLGRRVDDTNMPWEAILLDTHEVDDNLKSQINQFAETVKILGETATIKPQFRPTLHKDRITWDSQDATIDKKWNELISDLVELSEQSIIPATLTKPTGVLHAPLTIIWNYPSWSTRECRWGQVLDLHNPCVRMQYAKLGPSPKVRSQNRIPIREDWHDAGIDWEGTYTNWEAIEERCHSFNRWLNSHSRVILLLGKDNCLLPRDQLVEVADNDEIVKVLLSLRDTQPIDFDPGDFFQKLWERNRPMLFDERPWFEIVRCKKTKIIRHLIFCSYHPQTFFYDSRSWDIRVYHDLVWNAACGLAGIRVPRPMYFLRHATFARISNPWNKQIPLLRRAIHLRRLEKVTGVILPERSIWYAFRHMLNKNPSLELLPDVNGSWVGTIIRFFISKAHKVQQSKAWKESRAAARVYDTAIPNLLTDSATKKRLAATRITKDSETWKTSDGAKRVLEGSQKGCRRDKHYNAWPARIDALLRTKQAKEILAANPENLTACEYQCQLRLQALRGDLQNCRTRLVNYFKARVILWSKHYPRGLRYEGDGCTEPDDFQYDLENHPAVRLKGRWSTVEKRRFEVLNPGQN